MSSDTVEKIKDRLNIVDVVGQYVKLRKAGQNFVACCPFHNEKTPSFNVSPIRNAYYCFGCGAKGDAFSFVEHFEGVDFKGALKILADRAGVEVVFDANQKERLDTREKLFAVLEEAAFFFETALQGEKDVSVYLKGRGLSDQTISNWRLGFAKLEWSVLHDYLKKKGYVESEIEAAGLAKKGEKGTYYDRFRGRVMFPITDAAGRVIAFTGRIFKDDGKSAKYVNSPETTLFSKSHVLYGYDKAKFSIRKHDFSIVVEGQMDALLSFQSGYTNTVAVSGTALSRDHLTLLQRLSGNIVMAFDADSAGAGAAGKGAALALSLGMDVKVAALPKGLDPADLMKKNKDEWKKVIKNSKHIIDFYLDRIVEEVVEKRTLRLTVARRVLPFVALVPNKVDQAHFISRIADRIGIPEEAIRDEVIKVRVDEVFGEREVATMPLLEKNSARAPREKKEQIENMLGLLIRAESKAELYRKKLVTLVGSERAEDLLTERSEGDTSGASPSADIFALESRMTSDADTAREIDELFLNLEKECLLAACAHIAASMKSAELEGSHDKADLLAQELKEKSDRLREVKELLV